jgi:alpha-D-ribose 1-methylphosphonate 5-triphosphate diphosphatase
VKSRLVNAHVLTSKGLLRDSSLSIEDDTITAIAADGERGQRDYDLAGCLLAPGLIDLHCDALEKIIESRPGVAMPQEHVMPQADQLYAAAGITTIYHAISFAEHECSVRSLDKAVEIARDLADWRSYACVDHRLHARYEVADCGGLPIIRQLIDEGLVDMVSVMDHSPGQGQFQTFATFFAYYGKTYNLPEQEVRALADAKQAAARRGWETVGELIGHARSAGLAVASHDDDGEERVRFIQQAGGTISEFPVNLATARFAHEQGLATVMGAPNIVRGGSQSGNMAAIDALHAGVLDCLCADYVPWTMLSAACLIPERSECSLAQAFALVSGNPAEAAGLTDRGLIAPGARADLIQVGLVRRRPQVVQTWCGGQTVYRSRPPQLDPWPITTWRPAGVLLP